MLEISYALKVKQKNRQNEQREYSTGALVAMASSSSAGANSDQNENLSVRVAAAAQNLITVLTQNIAQGQHQATQGGRPEQGPSSIDQEMTRSFPGIYQRKSYLGKRKSQCQKIFSHSPPRKWKPFDFYVFLLNKNAEVTPSSSDEFELTQAGLGKRGLTMSRDMTHEEFSELLQNEYPKMRGLTGGWLLCKATGGQGRRKLNMIPPDSNGYTGTLVRTVSGTGKSILFVVPLQQELDIAPLPPEAEEFKNMPKAQCNICKVVFPLQILALHVKDCVELLSSSDKIETGQSPAQIPTPQRINSEEAVDEELPCPICLLKFAPEVLEAHASLCGERGEEDLVDDQKAEKLINSTEDVMETISQRVDRENQFRIQISRENLLERGILQWQRQKKSSPTAALHVSFFGEAGVDTGALRKEFLTEMMAELEGRFFEGPENQKCPRYSVTDFDSGVLRTVGEIFAVSLAQGGPAPSFLSPWAYSYICNGHIDHASLRSDMVADLQLQSLIEQVESSTEVSILGLSDAILNCGFSGAISVANKEQIVRAITLHGVLRLLPILDQLKEGLRLYGLAELLNQYPKICRPLFVAGEAIEANAEFVMSAISPELSEKGTNKYLVEVKMVNFLQDFLYEFEDNPEQAEDGGPREVTPSTFLQWLTGQGHVPLLPSEKKDFVVAVKFNHDCSAEFGIHSICYPVVSACTKTIVLPVKHMKTYDQFRGLLLEAFHLGQEFHKV